MSYGVEWMPGGVFLWTVLLFLIVPEFALIGVVVVAAVALAVLIAVAAAMLATPYQLVRTLRRRRAEHRRAATRPAPIATAIGRPATAGDRPGLAALAQPTTARTTP